MQKKDYIHVVLADDDQDDRLFFVEAFEELPIKTKVQTYKDGLALLDCINTPHFELPDLLFLDLNMPKKSGFECLVELRQHEKYSNLPIAIYSTSISEMDVDKAFVNGANVYIQKPYDFKQLKNILLAVVTNWQSLTKTINRDNFVFRI